MGTKTKYSRTWFRGWNGNQNQIGPGVGGGMGTKTK
jgi:hypothetical protein